MDDIRKEKMAELVKWRDIIKNNMSVTLKNNNTNMYCKFESDYVKINREILNLMFKK